MLLIDTNILIYLAKGDLDVVTFFRNNERAREQILVPTVTIIEFLGHPAFRGTEAVLLKSLLNSGTIAELDLDTAFRAAELRKRHNMKLGDSVIAASALMFNATLITRNVKDFRDIDRLQIITL